VDIWAERKDPFNEFCKRLMTMVFKRKGEHFNDFGYHQDIATNVNPANSETKPGPVSKKFKQIPKNSRIYF